MNTRYPVGTKVDALHQGSWSNATVKRELSPDRWLVGYEGWSESWDEEVGPGRIRERKAWTAWSGVITTVTVGLIIAGGVGVVHHFNQGAAYYSASANSGVQPRTANALSRGQSIFVEWSGTWYPATVLGVDDSSHATVHYDGFSSSYDESVTLDRIRVP
jgi:hypothetical protein